VQSHGRTVVVTGAGTGIGRALSLGFSRDGYQTIGLGRTESTLRETMAKAPAGVFEYRIVDVADADAVASVFRGIPHVDVLINNSAVYPRAYFFDHSADDWNRTILINLCGPANCCRAALPGMLKRNDGRIINVGSLADWWPIAGSSAYSASKGGLHALTKAIATEIDRERYPNVLVNELIPNATRTSMSDQGMSPDALYPLAKRMAEFPAGGPTGRMFNLAREIIANESIKAKLKRAIFRR
jgi:NAD(P)-dependent dehydrogenase (short-subunit alcohol dehydrogenase family)